MKEGEDSSKDPKLNPTAKEYVPKAKNSPKPGDSAGLNPHAKEFKPSPEGTPPFMVFQGPAPPFFAPLPPPIFNPEDEDDEEEEAKESENAVLPLKPVEQKKSPVAERKTSESKSPKADKSQMKTYTVEYLLSYKAKCAKRPKDMRSIEMPTKSKVKVQYAPKEETMIAENKEAIRNLRILLNKISKDNYARIYDTILNNFEYNAEILTDLAKMIYVKCVKEAHFLELYMGLIEQLFLKFKKGPKTAEDGKTAAPLPEKELPTVLPLDFKKVFLDICRSTLEGEISEDLLKGLPDDLDLEEKTIEKKKCSKGNIVLLGELLIRGAIPDKLVKECIDKLLKGKGEEEERIESACLLFNCIGQKLYEYFAFEAQLTTLPRRPKIRAKLLTKEIFDDYLDTLAGLKLSDKISAKLKLMIQDVVDARNTSWSNAFNHFPVNKPVPGKAKDVVVAYRKKGKSIEKQEEVKAPTITPVPTVAAGASTEKAAEDKKEKDAVDHAIEKIETRRMSCNEHSVFGINLEKYNKRNLEEKIRLRIHNIIEEYLLSGDATMAIDTMSDLLESNFIGKHITIGHCLLHGFSKKKTEFDRIKRLLLDMLGKKAFSGGELEDGVMVCLANFYDVLIDIPGAKDTFTEFVSEFAKCSIFGADFAGKCAKQLADVRAKVDEAQ